MNVFTRADFRIILQCALLIACCAGAKTMAADCEQPPFTAARQLALAAHPGTEPTFSSCDAVVGSDGTAAALFAFERETSSEDVKTFDVELMLVDAHSAAVQARLTRNNVWESDAYKIDSAGIADAAYPLHAGSTIVGVSESWSGSSSVSFYDISKLSLYERRGKTLVPLVTDFVTDVYQGEGCDLQITRELRPEPARGKAYVELRVVEKTSSVARDGQACEPREDEDDKTLLRYQGGKYPVPKRMLPFADD